VRPYRNACEKQIAAADEIRRAAPAAAVLCAERSFLQSGERSILHQMELILSSGNFYPDTWLIKESPTTARVLSAEATSSPPQRLLGAILVKNNSSVILNSRVQPVVRRESLRYFPAHFCRHSSVGRAADL